MKIFKALATFTLLFTGLSAGAAQPIINLGAGGKLTPGVYGEVKFGKQQPPLVASEPKAIIIYSVPRKLEPLYLHVPPEHMQQWDKHCREYQACDRPTYFVKSHEYEQGYVPPKSKIKTAINKQPKVNQGKIRGDSSRNGSGDGSGDGSGRGESNRAGGKKQGGGGDGSGTGQNKRNKNGNKDTKS